MPTFGVLHDFRQKLPWSVSTATYYEECLGLISEAEELGYSAVWLSEHHGTPDGFLPSPLVAAAAIAMRTERMSIGTNVLILPLHHPLRVAEDAAVVHALSGGRLVLAVGQGYAPHEFAAFGIEHSHRPSRLEEGIEVIRRAWRDGTTGFQGRRFDVPDGPFEPRPPAGAPIYVGAVAPTAVDRAVRLGDGLVVYVTEYDDLAARYDVLLEALAQNDRDRASFPFVWTTMVHLADSSDQAWEEAAPALAYLESPLRDEHVQPADLPRDRLLVGTPDEVGDLLQEIHAEVPFDHLAFWARLPGLAVPQSRRSQQLFANHVIPRLT
ncbi:alkanesulfonate monooxygenase SsuD/methylene tetrahydromethanopterin reductase-like flavin-dependent oxidoreductase (luciferase family) [Kribbella sp. VKM Ac-2527]|uniref:Alkanesulfonate monooxygenase SsuD/methylene tetrahydromethanopterin reductase-like flavin-dependent oxidoreductase (Luciferase family) n=1 Tax=Kribbella caucasensis TaxID=2512215 RepID=A0A4R6KLH9_9ACTN|nr:LLM class flavin-dependent oxidoreductase [Kribbella sp. VKM Ac-2527]TDO49985.1 alkanesulfonate monooxygenase SsuD/methylene tetrahydromethanopterin reductase-like flavin-dependent oxidoreductase (luciferase family) [Kribbella sp. VKM Ac-2527]